MISKTISMSDEFFNKIFNFAKETLKVSTSKTINFLCHLSLPIIKNKELYSKLYDLVINEGGENLNDLDLLKLISKKIIKMCEISILIFQNKELYQKLLDLTRDEDKEFPKIIYELLLEKLVQFPVK